MIKLVLKIGHEIVLMKPIDSDHWEFPSYDIPESEMHTILRLFKEDTGIILTNSTFGLYKLHYENDLYIILDHYQHKRLHYFFENKSLFQNQIEYKSMTLDEINSVAPTQFHTILQNHFLPVEGTRFSDTLKLFWDTKPVMISILLNNEVLIFKDTNDVEKAKNILKHKHHTKSIYVYDLASWEIFRKQYVDEFYGGRFDYAPKIYKL
jgi:hypothetical protein